jgi:hypothetical protein
MPPVRAPGRSAARAIAVSSLDVDDEVAAQLLLRFCEGAVGHELLLAARNVVAEVEAASSPRLSRLPNRRRPAVLVAQRSRCSSVAASYAASSP